MKQEPADDDDDDDDDDDEEDYQMQETRLSKRYRKSSADESDCDYVPLELEKSIRGRSLSDADIDKKIKDEDHEIEVKVEKSTEAEVDALAIRVEKLKNILNEQGMIDKIPKEYMNPKLLMAKLRLEIKRAKRIQVDLAVTKTSMRLNRTYQIRRKIDQVWKRSPICPMRVSYVGHFRLD